ncbi:MAG: hypothetical protein AAF657_39095 [Acidobacteriota bacterium]
MPKIVEPVQPLSVAAAQRALRQTADELRTIDARLAAIAGAIETRLGSSLPGELRDGTECVRTDLLHDAIESLKALANASESRVVSRRLRIDAAAELVAAFG